MQASCRTDSPQPAARARLVRARLVGARSNEGFLSIDFHCRYRFEINHAAIQDSPSEYEQIHFPVHTVRPWKLKYTVEQVLPVIGRCRFYRKTYDMSRLIEVDEFGMCIKDP